MTHGKRSAYIRGCRCAECTAANSAYQVNRKRRARGEEPLPPALTLVGGDDPAAAVESSGLGPVELATIRELASLSSPAQYPGQAASAIALARILDTRSLATTHPSAHRQLKAQLDSLAEKSVTSVSRLSKVTAMSARGKTG